MRIQGEIQEDIDALVEERRQAQRLGTRGVIVGIGEQLSELYCELREARARERYGTREEIAQQARVERELEKLSKPLPG